MYVKVIDGGAQREQSLHLCWREQRGQKGDSGKPGEDRRPNAHPGDMRAGNGQGQRRPDP